MKKVLITGASGFLGYHLIMEARHRGFHVDAGVRPQSNINHLPSEGITFIDIPYDSEKELLAIMESGGYDYVIHAAALTRAKNKATYRKVNVDFAWRIANATAKVGSASRFVFVSSLAAIGPLPYHEDTLITENTPPNPVTEYGKSKLMAESLLRDVKGLPLAIVRPTAVYGPRDKDLLVVFSMLLQGIDVYIGRKPQRLSFIHAADLASLILSIAISKTVNDTDCPIYHAADGHVYSRYDIADTLQTKVVKKPWRIHLPVGMVNAVSAGMAMAYSCSSSVPLLYPERLRELTGANWACDIEKITSELGFAPTYNLHDGLVQTFDWYWENRWI